MTLRLHMCAEECSAPRHSSATKTVSNNFTVASIMVQTFHDTMVAADVTPLQSKNKTTPAILSRLEAATGTRRSKIAFVSMDVTLF